MLWIPNRLIFTIYLYFFRKSLKNNHISGINFNSKLKAEENSEIFTRNSIVETAKFS